MADEGVYGDPINELPSDPVYVEPVDGTGDDMDTHLVIEETGGVGSITGLY